MTGLQEAIKELKEEIEIKRKQEEGADNAEEEPQEDEAGKPAEESGDKEEKPAEEIKTKVEEKPAEELDNSAYARMRREASAAKKKAEDTEARLASLQEELKALKAPATEEVAAPAEMKHAPEIEALVQDHKIKRAEREFVSLEDNFKRRNPDYGHIAAEYSRAIAQSIKVQNPRMSNEDIIEKTKETILLKAAKYQGEGYDPIEELYHEAKDLGFNGESMKKKEEPVDKEEEIRPDMKKVASNRARSSGMTGSRGESKGQMTKAAAADLSVAEWQKLTVEEKRRLMYH